MESRSSDDKSQFDNSSSCDDSDGSEYFSESKKLKLTDENYGYSRRIKNGTADISFEKLPTRQPKCFTKNAVMARQNRLRKKKYVEDLESEVTKLKHNNKSLSSILDSQSSIIVELRKELKYMKSVLANSTDISKLLKSINHNTGMSVSTSLDKSLTLKSRCVKMESPWSDVNIDDCFLSPDISNAELGFLFNDPDLCINPLGGNTSDIKVNDDTFQKTTTHSNTALREHNYTVNASADEEAGVCLHVSKHRVSLEFCSTCSDNAIEAWNEVD